MKKMIKNSSNYNEFMFVSQSRLVKWLPEDFVKRFIDLPEEHNGRFQILGDDEAENYYPMDKLTAFHRLNEFDASSIYTCQYRGSFQKPEILTDITKVPNFALEINGEVRFYHISLTRLASKDYAKLFMGYSLIYDFAKEMELSTPDRINVLDHFTRLINSNTPVNQHGELRDGVGLGNSLEFNLSTRIFRLVRSAPLTNLNEDITVRLVNKPGRGSHFNIRMQLPNGIIIRNQVVNPNNGFEDMRYAHFRGEMTMGTVKEPILVYHDDVALRPYLNLFFDKSAPHYDEYGAEVWYKMNISINKLIRDTGAAFYLASLGDFRMKSWQGLEEENGK